MQQNKRKKAYKYLTQLDFNGTIYKEIQEKR